jgi:hypothetical protein
LNAGRNQKDRLRIISSFSRGMRPVNRPWQPAFPQAMQRHGGQTRPKVPAAANKFAEEPAPDEASDGENRDAAERAPADNAKK